jgi:hypothetical protein
LVTNSQYNEDEYYDMIFQEGADVVWYESSGEEAHLACIVDFELYVLADVRKDEHFLSFPEILKPFDSKSPAASSGKNKTQEDKVTYPASKQDWDLGRGLHFKQAARQNQFTWKRVWNRRYKKQQPQQHT